MWLWNHYIITSIRGKGWFKIRVTECVSGTFAPSQLSRAQCLCFQSDKTVDQYWLTCLAPLVTLRVEEVANLWLICREIKLKTHPRPFRLGKEWFRDIGNPKPLTHLIKVIYFIFEIDFKLCWRVFMFQSGI